MMRTKAAMKYISFDKWKKLPDKKIKEIVLAYNCDILRGVFVAVKS